MARTRHALRGTLGKAGEFGVSTEDKSLGSRASVRGPATTRKRQALVDRYPVVETSTQDRPAGWSPRAKFLFVGFSATAVWAAIIAALLGLR
jgi:hypothetical protein